MDEYRDELLIGKIEFSNMIGYCRIYVYSKEGKHIPHFHIMDKSTLGKKFHTCVKIETPEYFHHTGKVDVLNSKQRKSLVEFLKSSHRNGTKWEMLIDLWNINNSTIKVDDNIDMPDYTNIR